MFDLIETEIRPAEPRSAGKPLLPGGPISQPDHPDLFSAPPSAPILPAGPPEPNLPEHKTTEPVYFVLSPVRIRQFIATASSNTLDHWLYYCTDDTGGAREAHANGLIPNADEPPILREAGAVTSWLAHFDEDGPDDDMEAGEPTIFRLRRSLVRSVIETDPDAPQQPGKRHYLLTGDRLSD
ncbi:hypothetical protein [Acetobacter fallax]|uniref:Uncharacterized protein n=1 Tax=Acetobacter fallax TaxID=1737473 RepID=A0ABX0KHR9_9PROT|nr:hypothetical protein [Acetobacter fallax]NHO33452.1 hypothetical protein [Acetobacter fallax]NHO37069.1 hypothetical protein [Acetobacter fallax]